MTNKIPSFPDLNIDLNCFSDDSVIKVCKRIVPGWADLKENVFQVSKISGGITNALFRVSSHCENEKNIKLKNVTVRIFGPNTELVIDRESERQILQQLSVAGFGAELYGFFSNGFVQSFIDAKTLEPKDMCDPKFVKLIAKEVRKFHEVNVQLKSNQVNSNESNESNESMLWKTINKFLALAKTVSFSEDTNKQTILSQIDFNKIEFEIEEMKKISENIISPIIFAHNDLLSANFMYNETENRIHVIDFEYSSYNYRGFDIGNHFNEYAGFDCDFSLYPDKGQQFLFFRNYLNSEYPDECKESELESLFIETNFYALLSHLFWALWAIIQAKYSPIDFDYLNYFFLRYDEFLKHKNDIVTMVLKTHENNND